MPLPAPRGAGLFTTLEHRRTAAVLQIQPAFLGQLAIGLGHGIEVDAQFERQLPHGGEDITGSELPLHQVRAKSVDDLPVGGNRRVEVDTNGEGSLH